MKPILQALILADHIYEDKATGKKIVAGIFNRVVVVKKNRLAGEKRPEPESPPQDTNQPGTGYGSTEVAGPGAEVPTGLDEGGQVGAGWWVDQPQQPESDEDLQEPGPQKPAPPQRPAQPQEPTRPQGPAQPSRPQGPVEPRQPAEARRPEEQEERAQPAQPKQPQEPRRPEQPQWPEEPKGPGEKGRMTIPEVRRAGSPYVYISLTEVQRDIPCVLRYVNLETYEALFEARFPVKSKGPLETLEIVLPVPPIPQIPGTFALELLCDGELVGSHRVLPISCSSCSIFFSLSSN